MATRKTPRETRSSVTELVGQRLGAARIAAGLTMRELAKKAGFSHQLIEKVEAGQNTTVATLDALCQAMGATLEVTITPPAPKPRVLPPPDRLALAGRLLAVLPRLPDTRADALLNEIALWEAQYPPQGE